jgi:hypothetical protein
MPKIYQLAAGVDEQCIFRAIVPTFSYNVSVDILSVVETVHVPEELFIGRTKLTQVTEFPRPLLMERRRQTNRFLGGHVECQRLNLLRQLQRGALYLEVR